MQQQRAASVEAYRELSGCASPDDPVGPEPVTGSPDLRAAWHEASAALGPVGGPDMRGMTDALLPRLRDIYPIETAWAPPWTGDQLRQVRLAAREAHLASIRASAEAAARRHRADHDRVAAQEALASNYQALGSFYEQRATVFAINMADRADWERATRQQRQLAVAADAELRHRHPGQPWPPLRSAEPEPPAPAEEPAPSAKPDLDKLAREVEELAARHQEVAARLAERNRLMIPAEDPALEACEPAFPLLSPQGKNAILQPPAHVIPPSPLTRELAARHDRDIEAGG